MKFDHRDHIRSAWTCIDRFGLAAAVERFPAFLQGFVAAAGQPGKYHETMTWGWLLVIADRWREGEDFDAFAARNPDLFTTPSVLERFWSRETLASERARHRFVFPDRVGGAGRPW